MEEVFELSNLLVMPFWVMTILLPRWRFTRRVMRSPWVAIGPAVLYAVLTAPRLPALAPVEVDPAPDEEVKGEEVRPGDGRAFGRAEQGGD